MTSALRFAPVDYPQEDNVDLLLGLADLFDIPSCFLHERTQSVTHSFNFEGSHTSAFRTWFHFLCKAIVEPHDFYLWLRCGFFLCRSPPFESTLICFGAPESLVSRIKHLPPSTWSSLDRDPTGLFSIVLADLHNVLDEQVWAVNDSVGQFEKASHHYHQHCQAIPNRSLNSTPSSPPSLRKGSNKTSTTCTT